MVHCCVPDFPYGDWLIVVLSQYLWGKQKSKEPAERNGRVGGGRRALMR